MVGNAPKMVGQLVLDTTGWDKGIKGVMGDLEGMRSFFDEWANQINQITNLIGGLGVSVAIGIAPGVVSAARLEQALAKVFSVGQLTTEEMFGLRAAVLEVGQGVVGPDALAAGLYNLASAGLDTQEQLAALVPVAQLATASTVSLDDASQLVVQTMRAFRLEAEDAARIANVVAASNANSSSNALRLAAAYRMVAANASAAGLTFEETTSALNLLINVFQNGEMAGTGLRNVITRLAAGGPELREAALVAGIALDDLNPTVVGMATATENLALLLASGASAFKIFGQEGMTSANILAGAAGDFREMEEAITGTNELAKQFAIQAGTLQNRLASLKNTVSATGTSYMQGLLPPLKLATEATKVFVEVLNSVPQPIKSLLGIIATLVSAYMILSFVIQKAVGWLIKFTIVQNSLIGATHVMQLAAAKLGQGWEALQAAVTGASMASREYIRQLAVVVEVEKKLYAARRFGVKALTDAAQAELANAKATLAASAQRTAAYTREAAAVTAARSTIIAKAGATFVLQRATAILLRTWNMLRMAFMIFIRMPLAWAAVAIGLALREMAKYADVARVAVDGLRSGAGEWIQLFEGLLPVLQFVGRVLTSLALGAVNLLAQSLAALTYALEVGAATMRMWLFTLDPRNWFRGQEQALKEYQDSLDAAAEKLRKTSEAATALADQHLDQIWGRAAESTESFARSLGMTEEALASARRSIQEFTTAFGAGIDDIVFNVDATALQQQLRSVDNDVRSRVTELQDFLADNPLIARMNFELEEELDPTQTIFARLMQSIEEAGERARQIVANNFVATLQREVDGAWIDSISEGAGRITAQYRQREAEIARAQEDARRSLAGQAGALGQADALFFQQRLLNRQRYERELRELDAQIAQQVFEAEREVADARVNAMEEGEARIRAQFALRAQDLDRSRDERLQRVQGDAAAELGVWQAHAELVELLNEEMLKEIQDHHKKVGDAYKRSAADFERILLSGERGLEGLRRRVANDSWGQLLVGQLDEVLAAQREVQDRLDDIYEEAADGIIDIATANQRVTAIMEQWVEREGLMQQLNLVAQRRFLAEREADMLQHAANIADIYREVERASTTDPGAAVRFDRDNDLRRLDEWRTIAITRAENDTERLLQIEQEYQARRFAIIEAANRAVSEVEAAALTDRANRTAEMMLGVARDGVAGAVTMADLQASAQVLRDVREELRAAGATYQQLDVLTNALTQVNAAIASLADSARDNLAEALGSARDRVRELNEQLNLTPEQRESAALARRLEQYDLDLAALKQTLRLAYATEEAYEEAVLLLDEAYNELRLAEQATFARAQEDAERERIAAVANIREELNQGIDSARIDLIEDELEREQALWDAAAAERRRQLDEDLTAAGAHFAERERILTDFFMREHLLEVKRDRDRQRAVGNVGTRVEEQLADARIALIESSVDREQALWDAAAAERLRKLDEDLTAAGAHFDEREAILTAYYELEAALAARRERDREKAVAGIGERLDADASTARIALIRDELEREVAVYADAARARRQRLDRELDETEMSYDERAAIIEAFYELEALTLQAHIDRMARINQQRTASIRAASRDVQAAAIDLIDDDVRRLEARFALEARMRSEALAEQIADLQEGSAERAAIVSIFNSRELVHEATFQRDRRKLVEAAQQRLLDIERGLGDEIADLRAASLRNEEERAQAEYRLARDRRRRDFEATLADLRITEEERVRLRTVFHAREEALEAAHQRRMTEIRKERARELLQPYAEASQTEADMRAASLQAAARQEVVGGVEREIVAREEALKGQQRAVEETKREIDALKERNTQLAAALTNLSRVRSYYQQVQELFETPIGPAQEKARTADDLRVAEQLYRQAVKDNLPLQERQALLQDLIALNERAKELGLAGVAFDPRLVAAARREYQDSVKAATEAAPAWRANEDALVALNVQLQGFEDATEAITAAIEQLKTKLGELNDGLGVLNWNEATGRFEDLAAVAERASAEYTNAIRSMVAVANPDLNAYQLQSVAAGMEQMLDAGKVDRAIFEYMRRTGQEMPTWLMEGLLEAPAPDGSGRTLAESLGITDIQGHVEEAGERAAGWYYGALGKPPEAAKEAIGDSVEEVLDETEDETQERVEEAGLTAGAGLMDAFARGVINNKQVLLDAVESVLSEIRAYLPSSDAKRGPLSDLTRSGGALVRTFVGGAEGESQYMARHIDRLFANAAPGGFAPGASRHHPMGVGAGGSGPLIGNLNVDGRSTQVTGAMGISARQLVDAARREIQIQRRMF
jgi:TP901 family phage tail tape measure protein